MLLLIEVNEVAVMVHGPQHGAMNTTQTTTNSGHAVAAGEGERIWIVADTMTLKATGESTGGSLVLLEILTAPGGGPPPHIHTLEDEFWYVLDGTFEIRIGDEVHALAPGGFAYAPRGTVHNFRNTADTASRILAGFTPGGMEGFSASRVSPRPTTGRRPRSTRTRSPARWRPRRSTESRPSPSTTETAARPASSPARAAGRAFVPCTGSARLSSGRPDPRLGTTSGRDGLRRPRFRNC
jgi:quercetin dioxygenase-like cupin family protein